MNNSEDNTDSVLGIQISDSYIRIAEVTKISKVPYVEAISMVALDPGIVVDGIIKKSPRFQKVLQKAISDAHPKQFLSKRVIISLPESRVFVHSKELTNKPKEDQVQQLLTLKLKKLISNNKNEYYSFSRIIKKKKQYRLELAFAQKKQIDVLQEELRLMGFEVVGIESESYALVRSLFHRITIQDPAVIVNVEDYCTGIYVFDGQGYVSSKTLPITSEIITKTIKHPSQVSVEGAKKLMVEKGVKPSSYLGGSHRKDTDLLKSLISEIKANLTLYKNSFQSEIHELVIIGSFEKIDSFKSYIKKKFPSKNILSPKTVADHAPIKRQEILHFYTAIGLALKGLEYKEPLKEGNFMTDVDQPKRALSTKESAFNRLRGIFKKETKSQESLRKDKEEESIPVTLRGFEKQAKKDEKVLKTFTVDIGKFVPKVILVIFTIIFLAYVSYLILQKYRGGSEMSEEIHANPRSSILVNEPFSASLEELLENDLNKQVVVKIYKRTMDFEATGKKASSDTVKGIVEVMNSTSTIYDLDATTRLVTSDGRVYTMNEDTFILYNSTVDATVTAVSPGESYELDKGTKLTFPGLSEDLQTQVYGVVKEGFTLADTSIVTKKDVENAKKKLVKKVQETVFENIDIKDDPDVMYLEEILKRNILSKSINVKSQDEVKSFSGTVKAEVFLLSFDKPKIMQYANTVLSNQLNTSERLEDYTITDLELLLDEYIEETNMVTVILQFNAIRNK